MINDFWPNPEALTNTLKDLISTIRDIAPNEELKALVDSIGDYVLLKINRKQVDDLAAIKKILAAFLSALKKINNTLTGSGQTPDIHAYNLPLPINIFNKLPRLVAAKFSPIAYLIRGDYPDLLPLILSLVNRPRNLIVPFPRKFRFCWFLAVFPNLIFQI